LIPLTKSFIRSYFMKLIKPNQISGDIMTLIDEADKFVIIVSPYCDFTNWKKIQKCFNNLKERKIPVDFYIRADQKTTLEQVKSLGYNPVLVTGLHTKLYINERYAIVSSMNLLYSSDSQSLDIAYQTESQEEYADVMQYYERYLEPNKTKPTKGETVTPIKNNVKWQDTVCAEIGDILAAKIYFSRAEGKVVFRTPKLNYDCFIWNSKSNFLRLTCLITRKQYEYLSQNIDALTHAVESKLELVDGRGRYDDSLWGTLKTPLLSQDIQNIAQPDQEMISKYLVSFITNVDKVLKNID